MCGLESNDQGMSVCLRDSSSCQLLVGYYIIPSEDYKDREHHSEEAFKRLES